MSYDPRNINQMYEQYGRTHGGSSNKGSTYDETPQTITRGLGTPLNRSFNTRDDDDDKKDDVGGVKSFLSDVFSLFGMSGAEPKEPPSFEGSSVYERKEFKPITYDPTENRITVTGYNPNTPMRSSDEIMGDVDSMLDRSDDAGYTPDPALGSTYDEVKKQDRPPTTIEDAINTAIENTIPTAGYKVKRGDTLSEIAQATGRTVKELQQLNDITDPRKMQAGSTLKIPVQTAQDIEVVEGARSMSELSPIRTANQSMMTGSQREYAPEDTSGFGGMGPDPSTGQEVRGLMSPTPEPVDAITAAKRDLTDQFIDDIGTYGETDHGDTPVQSNDEGADENNLDVAYGHKLKQSEKDSGMIHGIKFKNDDGTYIPLTEAQKREILKKDFEVETDLARTIEGGWDSKLAAKGSSWDLLDFKYQNALASLAFNTGGKAAGEQWDAVLDAAIAKDPKAFAREMRRTMVTGTDKNDKPIKEYTRGTDNRVAKELYYAGIISSLEEVKDQLPKADKDAGIPMKQDS